MIRVFFLLNQACNEFYQAALPEILEVLTSACGTHELPLAQTWVPCIQQADENYATVFPLWILLAV